MFPKPRGHGHLVGAGASTQAVDTLPPAVQSTAGAKPRWKPADPGNAAYSVSCRAELKRPRMDLRINKLRTDPGSSPEI